jgi:hypothetical protein
MTRIAELEARIEQLAIGNASLGENLCQCLDRLAELGDHEFIGAGSEDKVMRPGNPRF